MDEIKNEGYSSIFADYDIDEIEFSFVETGKLERVIDFVNNQGQLIKKSKDHQTIEYAFNQGRVIVDKVPLMNSKHLLRIDIITQSVYDSVQLIKDIGL